MRDIWATLSERTQDWRALDRQNLASSLWAPYVTARFARTGDRRALEFLYPYLSHCDAGSRRTAIGVAGRIYEGAGPGAVADLDYFTCNTDSFIRDHAVGVVGAAVDGHPEDVVLEVLRPFLHDRNHLVQRRAMAAMSRALEGRPSPGALAQIERVQREARADQGEVDEAKARLFSGHPDEQVWSAVYRPDTPWWSGVDQTIGTLVRGAGEEWYERAYRELYEPRLHAQPEVPGPRWGAQFMHRSAAVGFCAAAAGRGASPIQRLLHLQNNAVTWRSVLANAPACVVGSDREADREDLIEMARSARLQEQRLAAICLGRLTLGVEDEEAIALLRDLAGSRSPAIRASALVGLGMAARYTCAEALRELCLEATAVEETARAAIGALGMIFQASGNFEVFDDIRARAEAFRARPVEGRKQYRPLVQAYRSSGLVYQGTGSTEPFDFLLDALRPTPRQWSLYARAAGQALIWIEFPERTLTRVFGEWWN
jgi:HEAT repeat protein